MDRPADVQRLDGINIQRLRAVIEIVPKIVLVGNDQGLTDMMTRILKRGGYDVCGANGIQEAWTALSVCSPEVVVIERELPDGD